MNNNNNNSLSEIFSRLSNEEKEEGVTVEVMKGDRLVNTYKASKEEIEAFPLLVQARQQIEDGNPATALELICNAVKYAKGEEEVFSMLNNARTQIEEMEKNSNNKSSVGENNDNNTTNNNSSSSSNNNNNEDKINYKEKKNKKKEKKNDSKLDGYIEKNTIIDEQPHLSFLEKQGKGNILYQSYQEGDTLLCKYCNGLISSSRYKNHINAFCPGLVYDDEEDNDLFDSLVFS
eukprot:TRINITY_DN428_c1_g1_i2.p1 TRINITY_DN428_c1_g1~~TRINITY_DN428_c1_g1_i2.p1  ORF type:complete len:233 (+),score=73.51 TRINITY_DN428_c1_g1_i2:174-872(+)